MRSGPIRLLLDQGVPRDAASLLRELGLDAVHVGELGMAAAEDAEILDVARLQEAVIVTFDADFHAILAVSGARAPSVVRIRLQRMNAAAIVRVVQLVLSQYQPELSRGCMVTAKQRKITCHRLPIGAIE